MKIAVKKIDALKRELKFVVPKDRVARKSEEVYKDVGMTAKIKGFRPGKAPRHVVEAEYGALVKEETVKKLIPEIYQEGIAQEKLSPLDFPEIQDVKFKEGILTFTARLDIKPEIVIKKYKGIAVKRKSSQVTEEEIQKTLDYFRKSQGQDKDVAVDDDFVKGLGYPSLDVFKQSLTRQIEMDKDRQNRMDVENQIVDALIKEAKFTVPQSLVKKQLEHRLSEIKERFKSQGLSEQDIKKKQEEMHREIEKSSERDVAIYLLFDKIAEMEGIEVEKRDSLPVKVMEFLLKEADWKEKGDTKK